METGAYGATQVWGVPVRPRFKDNTLIKEANPHQKPRVSVRPGTYRKAFIMATNKRTLFKIEVFMIFLLGQAFSETR
jgi:hypothetical protein